MRMTSGRSHSMLVSSTDVEVAFRRPPPTAAWRPAGANSHVYLHPLQPRKSGQLVEPVTCHHQRLDGVQIQRQ
jgi:hypothetical protein